VKSAFARIVNNLIDAVASFHKGTALPSDVVAKSTTVRKCKRKGGAELGGGTEGGEDHGSELYGGG
jgi:hypothetical protein